MSEPPVTQARSFRLDAPRARVFSLFTALGERDWAPGCEPEMLSGAEERGSAFRTGNHDGQETVWVVTEYRPTEGRVSYARLALGSNLGLVDVTCTEAHGGGTDVSARYALTARSERAQAFVDAFLDAEHYSRMIDDWRQATSAALANSATFR